MSSIIVEQKIFEEVRVWLKTCELRNSYIKTKICQLISCMFCTGFWCGAFITGVTGFNIFNIGIFDPFLGGLLGGVSSWVIHLFMEYISIKLEKQGIKV